MLARLQYIGEHVFSGNMTAYAKTVGISTDKLKRILSRQGRFNVAMFTRFVESGIAAAEWMFCGTGPMHNRPDKLDGLAGYIATSIKSRYPVFDVFTVPPTKPKRVKKFLPLKADERFVERCMPIAKNLLEARAADNPVVLFLDDSAIRAGVSSVVAELIRKKYVTAVAMTFEAAALDYYSTKLDGADPAALQTAIFAASRAGLGLGEGLGALGFFKEDKRARSIIALGYDFSVPVTVHATIGAHAFHASPALYGAEYGAALGATSYVDMLIFIRHLQAVDAKARSLLINSGENSVVAQQLLLTAIKAGSAAAAVDFSRLRRAWLGNLEPDILFDVESAVGPYDDLFPAFLLACDRVYEGDFDDHTSKSRTGKSR